MRQEKVRREEEKRTETESNFQKMEASCAQRESDWDEQRRRKSEHASSSFKECLRTVGMHGHMDINHEREQMLVEAGFGGHLAKDGRQLSGGQQAFCALASSVAMWSFASSPVHALDEFDKGMDDKFLAASLSMILQRKRAYPGQLLLITPLSDNYAKALQSLGVELKDSQVKKLQDVSRR